MISKGIYFSILGCIISFIWLVSSDVLDRARPEDCDFCAIANYTSFERTLYDSDEFIAFKSIQPDCELHYLVIPKEHIKNIHSEEVNCEMITEMENICEEILREVDLEKRMLFHNPPFYSVKHLHMHCMGCTQKDMSWTNRRLYKNWFHDATKPDISCN